MPSGLINNTLSGINMGVTQQYQEGRYDSQVDSMINCIPSLTRGVIRRNPLESIGYLEGISGGDLNEAFVYAYDRGTGLEQYIVVIPGDGTLHTYNANSGALLYSISKPYLQAPIGVRAKDIFKAVTIGDHTFIVNNTVKTRMSAVKKSTNGYYNQALYWIKQVVSVTTNQLQLAIDVFGSTRTGSRQQGYVYTLNDKTVYGLSETRPGYPAVSLNNADSITNEIVRDSSLSFADKSKGSLCYTNTFKGQDWTWNDSFGNEASIGIWKDVENPEDLPANMPKDLDNFMVRVSGGTSAEFDDYFLQYSYTNKAWKEVAAPGSEYIINAETMPHVLYRLSTGFSFNTFREVSDDGATLGASAWKERKTGGENTIDDPSFIGREIVDIFFFKNRLGLLTSDSISLSQTGEYGGMFIQTLQEVLDDDPIDLAIASTDVTVLRHVVPMSGQLLIFADDTQFSISSTDGPLTPKTANILSLSNYTYGALAKAKAIGNKVIFSNQAGGYSNIYAYSITDQGSNLSEANIISLHIPTYIDASLSKITGHDVLGYMFFETEAFPKQLVVLTHVSKGGQELQNAFHKWTFTKNLVSTHIINNLLYILFSDGDLCKMSLEVPGDIRTVRYLDEYTSMIEAVEFDSLIRFSEFQFRDGLGKGTVRGRYQIKTIQYTIEDYSEYMTIIANTENILDSIGSMGPTWDDTLFWDDALSWGETDTYYTRTYTNDSKVTVMTNSKNLSTIFRNNPQEPEKGFEVSTLNIEALFSQRSKKR